MSVWRRLAVLVVIGASVVAAGWVASSVGSESPDRRIAPIELREQPIVSSATSTAPSTSSDVDQPGASIVPPLVIEVAPPTSPPDRTKPTGAPPATPAVPSPAPVPAPQPTPASPDDDDVDDVDDVDDDDDDVADDEEADDDDDE